MQDTKNQIDESAAQQAQGTPAQVSGGEVVTVGGAGGEMSSNHVW